MIKMIFTDFMQAVQYADENCVEFTITHTGDVWVLSGKKKGN